MKQPSEPKKVRTIGLRVSDDLFDWINKLALENTRTTAGQTEHLLKIARVIVERNDDVDNIVVIREKLAKYKFGGPNA